MDVAECERMDMPLASSPLRPSWPSAAQPQLSHAHGVRHRPTHGSNRMDERRDVCVDHNKLVNASALINGVLWGVNGLFGSMGGSVREYGARIVECRSEGLHL